MNAKGVGLKLLTDKKLVTRGLQAFLCSACRGKLCTFPKLNLVYCC